MSILSAYESAHEAHTERTRPAVPRIQAYRACPLFNTVAGCGPGKRCALTSSALTWSSARGCALGSLNAWSGKESGHSYISGTQYILGSPVIGGIRQTATVFTGTCYTAAPYGGARWSTGSQGNGRGPEQSRHSAEALTDGRLFHAGGPFTFRQLMCAKILQNG